MNNTTKTHKYLTPEEHREICPRYNILKKTNKSRINTMVCEDCLITKDIPNKVGRWLGFQMVCDLSQFE